MCYICMIYFAYFQMILYVLLYVKVYICTYIYTLIHIYMYIDIPPLRDP